MKSDSAEPSPDAQSSIDRTLIHDLRGPTVNALAFNREIEEASDRICQILADPARVVSAEERQELSELLEHDLVPCISYVQKALKTMEMRLKGFENV